MLMPIHYNHDVIANKWRIIVKDFPRKMRAYPQNWPKQYLLDFFLPPFAKMFTYSRPGTEDDDSDDEDPAYLCQLTLAVVAVGSAAANAD